MKPSKILPSTLLLAVMVVASYTFAVSLSAGASGRIKTLQSARLGAYGTVALIAVAVLCLAYAFVSHDFRLRYVAHYSDRSMPTVFLFTALWNDGMVIWDIGGGGKGGTLQNPIEVGRVVTRNGEVHNMWWFHDPTSNNKRFVFVGEEGAATLFSSSAGDVHVVDIADPAQPREVAFFNVPGAGTHNFSVDESRGLLYAAFYNGGVQVLDVRGDLAACTALQKAPDGRCDLRLMGRLRATGVVDATTPGFVWGVQYTGSAVYASDMINGLVKLAPVAR